MPFEDTNVVRTQHDKSQLAAFQVLLIFQALIGRDHNTKPRVFRRPEKITVDEPSPAEFRSGENIVFREIMPKRVRDVLIKQNAQIAGSRRTVLRP